MIKLADLADANIAILGAGREGQAVYAWLRGKNQHQALTLIAESAADAGLLERLDPGDRLYVEPLTATRLQSFDVLIRSPGISPYREPLREAMAAGVPVIGTQEGGIADFLFDRERLSGYSHLFNDAKNWSNGASKQKLYFGSVN